jgi:predicted RNA-binding protein with PIN domain
MKYLIDGYNLLHQSPVMQTGTGPKWLEQQRDRLVVSLAKLLSESDRENTVVVFDAHSGQSASTVDKTIEGIRVRFAHHYSEADDLIESMIEEHPNPQSLIVISSDRRLKRAARSRRAKCIDGRQWLDSLEKASIADTEPSGGDPEDIKNAPVESGQVEQWMRDLGLDNPSISNLPTEQAKQQQPVQPLSMDDTELKDSETEPLPSPKIRTPKRGRRR